jgi:hypothetical protein
MGKLSWAKAGAARAVVRVTMTRSFFIECPMMVLLSCGAAAGAMQFEDAFAFPSLRMNWLTPVLLKISADFGRRVGPAAMAASTDRCHRCQLFKFAFSCL